MSNEVHCVDQLRQIQINTEKQIGSNFRILGSSYTDKNKMKWFVSSRGAYSTDIAATRWARCFYTCLNGVRVFHVASLFVFMFLVPCCDVNYDFSLTKTMFDSSSLRFI